MVVTEELAAELAEELGKVRSYRAEDAECRPARWILAGASDEELKEKLSEEEIRRWRLAVALEALEELERDGSRVLRKRSGQVSRALRRMVAGLLG